MWSKTTFPVWCRQRLRTIPWPLLAVLLMVALGMGCNAGVFALRSLLVPYFPYLHPEQLVVFRSSDGDGGAAMPAEDFLFLRQQTDVFQNMSAATERDVRLETRTGIKDVAASLVTSGSFTMMGDQFSLGHDFDPVDLSSGEYSLAILSHAMWKRLGADPLVVGSTLLVNGTPHTVVGVLTPGLRDRGAPVTLPLSIPPRPDPLHPLWVSVTGRLRLGVSMRRAQSDLNSALVRISGSNLNLVVEPLDRPSFHNDLKLKVWLVLGLVAFLVLTECIGVMNLFRLRSEASLKRELKVFGGF